MSHALVIGLGKSGVAAAKLLHQSGWDVQVSDRGDSPLLRQQQQQLAKDHIPVFLSHSPDWEVAKQQNQLPELVVVSPGVPWDGPLLVAARNLGLETIGEMELAWRHLGTIPWVAITGTNGKTTTTALTAAIFQAAGLNAPACGNIGDAACELALQYLQYQSLETIQENQINQKNLNQNKLDWVIAEISSYQIESSTSIAPHIGLWTTLTPDHLERHKTLENYAQIKAKLLQASKLQIFNGDDPYLHNLGITARTGSLSSGNNANNPENIYWTSIKGKAHLLGNPDQGCYLENGWVYAQNTPIVEAQALRMGGSHNQQNLLMAVLAAKLAGITPEVIAQGVTNFPGVPHRLEHITTWQGIDFINDSKATNYDAAIVGLNSVPVPAILIAGGEAKKGDASAWLALIKAKASTVLLIGKAAPEFAQKLEAVNYFEYEIVETMAGAIDRAKVLAPQQQAPVVLLSPACASFDQYPNFEARGDDFRRLCLEIS